MTGNRASKSLFRSRRFEKAEDRCRTTNQPQRTDKKIDRIAKERRLIAFDGVSDELKNPADDEQRQGRAPIEEKQRQRHDNHRNAERVAKLIQRMPMFGFVVLDE